MIPDVFLLTALIAAPTVAILPIARNEEGITINAVHEAIVDRVHHRFLTDVAPYNELLVHDPTIGAAAIRACKADTACIARAAEQHGVDLIVIVTQHRTDGAIVIAATAVDRQGRIRAEHVETNAPSDVITAFGVITETILEAAQIPVGGRVTVKTTPREAMTTFLPPPFRTLAPNEFLLEPGRYHYRTTNVGQVAHEGVLDIGGGEQRRVDVALVAESTPLTSSPLFWGTVGGAALAGAVAIFVVLRSGPDGRTCLYTPRAPCP